MAAGQLQQRVVLMLPADRCCFPSHSGGGEDVQVTPENVLDFAEKAARFLMVESVRPALEAIRRGSFSPS